MSLVFGVFEVRSVRLFLGVCVGGGVDVCEDVDSGEYGTARGFKGDVVLRFLLLGVGCSTWRCILDRMR